MAILRNMAHTEDVALSYRCMGNIFSTKSNLAVVYGSESCKSVNKLGLSVTVNTGDADNFSPSNFEGNVLYCVIFMKL